MTIFSFVVEQKHLDIQMHAAVTYNGSDLFRGACELPEYHQCEVDDKQVLFEAPIGKDFRAADTVHSEVGVCDYKINSKNGVFLSKSSEYHAKTGVTKAFVVWSWVKGPREGGLIQIGDTLSYEILGWVDAKQAIKSMNKITRRVICKKFNVL